LPAARALFWVVSKRSLRRVSIAARRSAAVDFKAWFSSICSRAFSEAASRRASRSMINGLSRDLVISQPKRAPRPMLRLATMMYSR